MVSAFGVQGLGNRGWGCCGWRYQGWTFGFQGSGLRGSCVGFDGSGSRVKGLDLRFWGGGWGEPTRTDKNCAFVCPSALKP